VLTLLELSLSYFGQGINDPLEDVFLLEIAVIVDEYLQQMLSVLAKLVEHIEDKVFVVVVRVARIKDP